MNEKKIVYYAGEVTFFPNDEEPIVAKFDRVYGHPRYPDGKRLTSSKIVSIADGGVIETLNTVYQPRRNEEL